MSQLQYPITSTTRGSTWKWWICGLLLLATMVNYMDRMTLNQTSKRIMEELGFQERGYGELESAFSYAFALGAVLFGWLADRVNVRWLYPVALLGWSAAGFATGLASEFYGLLACRFMLGLSEAGHWPCALRTTQSILSPAERPMGNSILQSGAALGAVFTPLIILALPKNPGTWRYPFLIVGAAGATWVVFWLVSVRSDDLNRNRSADSSSPVVLLIVLAALFAGKTALNRIPELPPWLPLAVSSLISIAGIAFVFRWLVGTTQETGGWDKKEYFRRLAVLVVVVVTINGAWHFFRAWLPLFLQKQHSYSEDSSNWFMLTYYISTDIGSLTSGAVALLLARRGLPVHTSRLVSFTFCALLCTLAGLAAFASPGPVMLGLLLLVGFGALGLFPNYYSLTQELTTHHQGKVTGALGCSSWLALSPIQETVGQVVQDTGSYSLGMTVAGFAPMLGLAALVLFWGGRKSLAETRTIAALRPSPKS